MRQLKITDVRILPGDSGFLIDDGTTSILYDSGFGFTGKQMADRISQELGERSLDYIFLTHSHYDHVLGSVQISKQYPNVQIIAGTYTKQIFQKASACAVMQEMDRKAAAQSGFSPCDAMTDFLRVDIPVRDGDILNCGSMQFTVIELPGHTRCSVGFYLAENKLLLGTETLGVYIGQNTYLPSYLVGYEMTVASFEKALSMEPKQILVPHYGVLKNEEALQYLKVSEQTAKETAQWILSKLKQGVSQEKILTLLTRQLYHPQVERVYPYNAFQLNTSIMIRLIENELLHGEKILIP